MPPCYLGAFKQNTRYAAEILKVLLSSTAKEIDMGKLRVKKGELCSIKQQYWSHRVAVPPENCCFRTKSGHGKPRRIGG